MPRVRDEPLQAAEAVVRELRAKLRQDGQYQFPTEQATDAAVRYGNAVCQGPESVMAGFERTPFPTLLAFYQELAQRLDVPQPARVALAIARLIHLGQPTGFTPQADKIAQEWDGELPRLHAERLLPQVATLSQEEFDRRIFWRQAAWNAAMYVTGGDRRVAWVADRYVQAEMAGLTPNPFRAYLII